MLGGREHHVAGVGGVQGHEQGALPAGHREPGERDGEQGDRGGQHHRDVEGHRGTGHRDAPGGDQRRQAEHHPDVEDVAAHHVAHGQVALTAAHRDDGGRQLGQRCPDGHHGQPDHQAADPQRRGDAHRPLDEQGRAGDQQGDPQHHEQHGPGDRGRGRLLLGPDVLGTAGAAAGSAVPGRRRRGDGGTAAADHDGQHRVQHHGGEEDHSVHRADPPVEGHEQQPDRQHDHPGEVEAHQPLLHREGNDEGGEPEDEQDVDDVAADHVPDGQARLVAQHGADGDGELRRRRGGRDHGEPDHEGGDPHPPGERGRPPHQEFSAENQQRQPCDDPADVQEIHGQECTCPGRRRPAGRGAPP